MSALISGVYFDSVLVATDTYSGAIPGRRAQKLFSLPHLPAVIVGRGSARLLKLIWLEAAALECPFDDLVEAPPSIIRKATGGPTASTRHTRTFLFSHYDSTRDQCC
jgi:hypothetical protein